MRGIRVRRVLVSAGAVAVLLATTSGCSNGEGTGGLGVKDAGATRACAELAEVLQQRPALSERQLRQRLGQIYTDASSSANSVLKAQAVAIFADATVMASGGESPSLDSDLNAMRQSCSGLSG
jgi:hypothetical protein